MTRGSGWTAGRIPDQTGRTAVVTGANAGIGFEAALTLVGRGAHVILGCRSEARGTIALTGMLPKTAEGSATLELLDLANLESVRGFASRVRSRGQPIDLLINNAGVMVPPVGTTSEGFELQIGINHLGHFALTGLLLDSIRDAPMSRIVTVSSIAHQTGRIDFSSFRSEGGYRPFREYRQSKLANLMFALELDRRLQADGREIRSLAAHPGVTRTDLVRHRRLFDSVARLVGMSPAQGALPILFAATSPDAEGGGYYGPDGFHEMRGYPAPARIVPQAKDRVVQQRLWEVSETLTGVGFSL